MSDPVELTQALVRCPSVTPQEGGALGVLEARLSAAGFTCHRADRGEVSNLIALWGRMGNGPVFGFNGHTDVVPIGNRADWSVDPFGGEIKDGKLWGRGATDMKSGVAAFVAAAIQFTQDTPPEGGILITITGDEEGDAKDGTAAILDFMQSNRLRMDHCLVGEPTSPNAMGDAIKIGRRGSMTARITVAGTQGHSAYPDQANNPVHAMSALTHALLERPLDKGTEHFQPSGLQVVTIDTGNPANNVIPATCKATVNIRFNDAHSAQSLTTYLSDVANRIAAQTSTQIDLAIQVSGDSFVTKPGPFVDMVQRAVEAETGRVPEASTTGGTSDARFIKAHCPVVEAGLVGKTMHQVDEHVEIAHIHQLKAIYLRVLGAYFAAPPK
ncbi:MAG: succinyl-diaminopimelate desuccinylase [Pseudomonadota bacterium]